MVFIGRGSNGAISSFSKCAQRAPQANIFFSNATSRVNFAKIPEIFVSCSFSSKSSANSSSANNKTLRKIPSFMNVSNRNAKAVQGPDGVTRSPKTAEDAVNNLLYNLPKHKPVEKKHILSVFVDNEAGVLSKVSGLLSARGFNIDSLSVANTDVKDLSRMTIVLKGGEEQVEQAKRQLQDLCDVWAVFDYQSPETTFERELCLVKVSCIPPTLSQDTRTADDLSTSEDAEFVDDHSANVVPSARHLSYEEMMAVHFHRQALIDIANLFGGKISDVGSETVIIELCSWSRRVDAFLKMLAPYKIVEAARTGVIAMAKSKVITPEDNDDDDSIIKEEIDISALPPS